MKKELLVGVSTIPGQFIIPGLLKEIIQKIPGVELRLEISDSQKTFDKVVNVQIEVGIIGTDYEHPDVDLIPFIKEDKLSLIVPIDSPLAKKEKITLDELRVQNFIGRELGSGTRATYERAFEKAGFSLKDLNLVAEVGDTEACIQAVEGGAGVSVVSTLAARNAIEAGRVKTLGIEGVPLFRNFYIITNKKRPLSDVARQFISFLKSKA
ncbi:MAG: LysR substrate-binding domain-containing protein [Nitrospirota bacterium]